MTLKLSKSVPRRVVAPVLYTTFTEWNLLAGIEIVPPRRVLRCSSGLTTPSTRDLQRAMMQGQFREDLYYRLNVFAIQLPALRERQDDILPLTEAFLAEFAQRFGRPPAGVSRDARRMLVEYHWPGNVRELHNSLEDLVAQGLSLTETEIRALVGTRPALWTEVGEQIALDLQKASLSASRLD